jgi:hypothetical protein
MNKQGPCGAISQWGSHPGLHHPVQRRRWADRQLDLKGERTLVVSLTQREAEVQAFAPRHYQAGSFYREEGGRPFIIRRVVHV